MPLYHVVDTETDEEETCLMKWVELQAYLAENPTKQLLPAAPNIVSGIAGRHKTSEGFKDVLRNIKSHHRGSTIDVT